MSDNVNESLREGLPPYIKTWPQLYALVIGALVAEMIMFYLMMRFFE